MKQGSFLISLLARSLYWAMTVWAKHICMLLVYDIRYEKIFLLCPNLQIGLPAQKAQDNQV